MDYIEFYVFTLKDERLTLHQAFLLSVLIQKPREFSNKQLAKITKSKERTITRDLAILRDLGYISIKLGRSNYRVITVNKDALGVRL